MNDENKFAPAGSTLAELMAENGGDQLRGYEAQLFADLKKESARGCAIGFRSPRPTERLEKKSPRRVAVELGLLESSRKQVG